MNTISLELPQVDIPSITSSALLVTWSTSIPTLRKRDKKATRDIEQQNGAESGVINATKALLGNCEEFKAVTDFANNARNRHYAMTHTWIHNGPRLVSTLDYINKHMPIMSDLKQEIERLWAEFIAVYDWAIMQEQARMGSLWEAELYPSAERLQRNFAVRLEYMPVAPNFITELFDDANASLNEQYQKQFMDKITGVADSMHQQLHKTLTTLARQLDVDENGKGNRLYDTVFDRALELTDMLGTCNLTGSTQMEAMRQKLEQTFRGLNLSKIKNSPTAREDTKASLEQVIASLPSLDM